MSKKVLEPIVSIIVPVFNVEEYLEKCIQSLINQTLQDIEVILVNDGSTDLSAEICDRYKKLDNRIIVIHKENGGVSSARNEGLKVAKGNYIGFVDSDDYVELDTYEKLVHALIDSKADISICGRIVENNDTKNYQVVDQTRDLVFNSEDVIRRILLKQNIYVAPWDKLYKSELFKGREFPIGKIYEDIYLIPEIISNTQKIVCIKEAKYHYMIRSQSITQSKYKKSSFDLINNTELLYKYIVSRYPNLLKEARYYYFENILACYSKYISSDSLTKKAFRQDKLLIKNRIKTLLIPLLKNPYPTKKRKLQYILIFLGASKFKRYFKRG